MLVYIMAIALIVASIALSTTDWVSRKINYLVGVGVLMALVNALYMAHWIAAVIIVVVSVGAYLFLKNMVVG
ncbi:MAG: hypothetical protein ACRC7I_13255 [Selenomonadaceae bacterium]